MSMTARRSLALLAALLGLFVLGNGGPPRLRSQIWIYWGGGVPRDWSGRVLLPRGSSIVWLADLEAGDEVQTFGGLERPEQLVPTGPVGGRIEERAGRLGATGRPGFDLATTTSGAADGVVLEIEAPADRTIDLEVEGLSLSLPVGGCSAEQRLFDVGGGNVVLVGGRDLATPWPGVAGRHRASLHTHSGFSSNRAALGDVVASLVPWTEHVWWTDHNALFTPRVVGGDFDGPESLDHWILSGQGGTVGIGAGPAGEGSGLRLEIDPSPRRDGTASAWVAPVAGLYTVGMHTSAEPRLRWAWRPPTSDAAAAFVEVRWRRRKRVRYVSRPVAGGNRTDIVIETPPGEWRFVERLVAGDRRNEDELPDDRIYEIRLGVLSAGAAASAGFDAVELESSLPESYLRLREERLATARPAAHFGTEESVDLAADRIEGYAPHLTLLLPGSLAELEPAWSEGDGAGEASRRSLIAAAHSAGGCVGAHHLQADRSYERLLDGSGLGADLFEIGAAWPILTGYGTDAERRARDACRYPALDEDEVFPLLVRWDRTTARGLLLTGYGAPDLNGRFDRATNGFFDRWLTWIESDDERPEALLRALRSGRAVGVEWRSPVWIDLATAGGLPAGKLVATDRERLRLEAHVEDAVPGSEVRWLVAPFAGDRGDDPPPARMVAGERLPAGTANVGYELEVGVEGSFGRLEVREPTGHLVAFSNPLHAIPFWPEEWPFGRVAFDWRGVRLLAERGLLLDEARIEDGRLWLAGEAFEEGAELRLGSSVTPISAIEVIAGRARPDLGADRHQVEIAVEPGERFELVVAFDRSLADPPVGSLFAVPRRKQVHSRIDVGDPGSEGGRIRTGFGPPELRGLLPRRRITEQSADFEIAVPDGEPYWVEIEVPPGRHPRGALFAGDTEIGRFGRLGSLVFAVDGGTARDRPIERFTIRLDEAPEESADSLEVERILVYRGEGVVDY